MLALGSILLLIALVLIILALAGVVVGKIPLLRVSGRKNSLKVLGFSVLGAFAALIFVGISGPNSTTPAQATSKPPTLSQPIPTLTPAEKRLKAEAARQVQATQLAAAQKAKRVAAENARKKQAQIQYAAAQADIQRRKEARAAEQARLAREPTPSQAEIVVQRSDDNYGVEPYFVLSSGEQEVAVTGKVRLVLTVKDFASDSENPVYDETTEVSSDMFSSGTRGLGAFKRDAIFFRLPKVSTEKLSSKSGNAYLTFTSSQGIIVKAKDSVFYP